MFRNFLGKLMKLKWTEENKKQNQAKKKKLKKRKIIWCYYCKRDDITEIKEEHRETCVAFLKAEKKSVRVAKQIYFGKKN